MAREFIPQNDIESIIEDTLVNNGYEKSEIEFHGTFPDRYVRIGYWECLETKPQLELSHLIHEDSFEDEDTLTGFLYHIISI
jgi:hypothetical protein